MHRRAQQNAHLCQADWNVLGYQISDVARLLAHEQFIFAGLFPLGLYLGIEGFLLCDEIVCWFFGLESGGFAVRWHAF